MEQDREYVKKIRTNKEYSQDEWATLLNMSASTIRKYEQGKCRPSKAYMTLVRLIDRMPGAIMMLKHLDYIQDQTN